MHSMLCLSIQLQPIASIIIMKNIRSARLAPNKANYQMNSICENITQSFRRIEPQVFQRHQHAVESTEFYRKKDIGIIDTMFPYHQR